MDNLQLPTMLTLAQASEMTGLSYHTIRTWCLSGQLPHIRAGGSRGKILLTVENLRRFLSNEKNVETDHAGD